MRKQKKTILIVAIIAILIIIAAVTTIFIVSKSKNENNEEKTAKKEIEESVGMDETYKKYVESKDNILKTKDEPTIIYKEYDEYVFIDKNGKEITREEYDEICENPIKVEIEGKIREIRPVKKDNKYFFIDSRGKKVFDVVDEANGVNDVGARFSSCIYTNEKTITNTEEEIKNDNSYSKALFLEETSLLPESKSGKYDKYEENTEGGTEYLYFKNENITDKVLQVISFFDDSEDTEFKEILENKVSDDYKDSIDLFYSYKKEYYLIDTKKEEKMKLDCNNLIYNYDFGYNPITEEKNYIEYIMLYNDGSIPYYDENSTGYFNIETGEKTEVDSNMLTIEIDDKYQYLYNKDTKSSLIINKNTGEIEKEYEDSVINIFEDFNIIEKDNEFILTDKELNEKFMSNEEIGTKIFGDFLLVYEDVEEPENCLYKIENNQLIEIGQPTKNWEVYANYLVEDIEKSESQSIYEKTGVIDELI